MSYLLFAVSTLLSTTLSTELYFVENFGGIDSAQNISLAILDTTTENVTSYETTIAHDNAQGGAINGIICHNVYYSNFQSDAVEIRTWDALTKEYVTEYVIPWMFWSLAFGCTSNANELLVVGTIGPYIQWELWLFEFGADGQYKNTSIPVDWPDGVFHGWQEGIPFSFTDDGKELWSVYELNSTVGQDSGRLAVIDTQSGMVKKIYVCENSTASGLGRPWNFLPDTMQNGQFKGVFQAEPTLSNMIWVTATVHDGETSALSFTVESEADRYLYGNKIALVVCDNTGYLLESTHEVIAVDLASGKEIARYQVNRHDAQYVSGLACV